MHTYIYTYIYFIYTTIAWEKHPEIQSKISNLCWRHWKLYDIAWKRLEHFPPHRHLLNVCRFEYMWVTIYVRTYVCIYECKDLLLEWVRLSSRSCVADGVTGRQRLAIAVVGRALCMYVCMYVWVNISARSGCKSMCDLAEMLSTSPSRMISPCSTMMVLTWLSTRWRRMTSQCFCSSFRSNSPWQEETQWMYVCMYVYMYKDG